MYCMYCEFLYADIDECMMTPSPCPNMNCSNTVGSYYCFCADGFNKITDSSNRTFCQGRQKIDDCKGFIICSEVALLCAKQDSGKNLALKIDYLLIKTYCTARNTLTMSINC